MRRRRMPPERPRRRGLRSSGSEKVVRPTRRWLPGSGMRNCRRRGRSRVPKPRMSPTWTWGTCSRRACRGVKRRCRISGAAWVKVRPWRRWGLGEARRRRGWMRLISGVWILICSWQMRPWPGRVFRRTLRRCRGVRVMLRRRLCEGRMMWCGWRVRVLWMRLWSRLRRRLVSPAVMRGCGFPGS